VKNQGANEVTKKQIIIIIFFKKKKKKLKVGGLIKDSSLEIVAGV
jgi:hypothetical protein